MVKRRILIYDEVEDFKYIRVHVHCSVVDLVILVLYYAGSRVGKVYTRRFELSKTLFDLLLNLYVGIAATLQLLYAVAV